jgi:pyrroloquinoline quinone biosynthesis protein B
VHVVLLGTAAGGGFPQWNCWCPSCATARSSPDIAKPRSQSSAAISADGIRWFLLNASPDVRDQLKWIGSRPSGTELRHVPIDGVLMTDAELDHSVGLLLLREAGRMPLITTAAVSGILDTDSRISTTTRAFSEVPWTMLPLDAEVELTQRDGRGSGLTVEAFAVPAGPPRFSPEAAHGHTVGFTIRQRSRNAVCAFVPGCGDLDATLLDRLRQAQLLLFDGTFWKDDELIALGIGTRTGRQMDHLPMSGTDGSLERLAALPCRHRVYTHINNTNPVLVESSPERRAVAAAGITVGEDGMRFEL